MNYSDDPFMVRVDFFKPSGKWYTTEAVKWLSYDNISIIKAFAKSLKNHLKKPEGLQPSNGELRLSGMIAICLNPYHEYSTPAMLEVDKIENILANISVL